MDQATYLVVFSESFFRSVTFPHLGVVVPPQNGHFSAPGSREEGMNCVANYETNVPEFPCDGPCDKNSSCYEIPDVLLQYDEPPVYE